MQTYPSSMFPVNCLPAELQNTIWTVEQSVQSPIPLIVASTFSTMAIACQGLIDVRMPTGQIAPTSMFFITTAESGERKSATDRLLNAPILALQSHWAAAAAERDQDLAAALDLWQLEHRAVESRLRRAIKRGQPAEELRAVFKEHARQKPQASPLPHILYSDTTPEALLFNLHKAWPYAALVSSEGSTVLSGPALRQIGLLNELWDGSGAIRVDRKTEPSFVLQDARLSLSIMLQRKPFEQFLNRNRGEAWETGFLSRALIAEPLSRQGSRFDYGQQASMDGTGLQWFHARADELLRKALEVRHAQQPRELLDFTPEAAAEWRQFANWVEGRLAPGGNFDDIRGFASKLTNNMSRLAAVMHYFCGGHGPIGVDATRAAISVADWYATEFKRLFGSVEGWATRANHGRLLADWLWRRYKSGGGPDCSFNELYRCGPNPLRKRADLELALEVMQAHGAILIFRNSKPSFVRLVMPSPLPPVVMPQALTA